MKISTVVKPAMLFAAGSAATAAGAAPVIEEVNYTATPGGTAVSILGTRQYSFDAVNVTNDEFPVYFYFLNGENGSQVTKTRYGSSTAALNATNYDDSVKTGFSGVSDLAISDDYYGLRFTAGGRDYKGFAGLINGGSTINQIGYELASGVPEPASWALMIAGFGGVGLAMRRRRRQAGVAAVA